MNIILLTVANGNGQQTLNADSAMTTQTNGFGVISLSSGTDSVELINLPMQRGDSTLVITPEDEYYAYESNPSQGITKDSVVKFVTVKDTAFVRKSAESENVVAQQDSSKSAFAEFDEKVLRINYMKVGDVENGWIFWGLLLSLVTFGILKLVFPQRMSSTFSNVFNYNFAQKEFDKSYERSQLVTIIMQILFAFNAGLLAFFSIKYYQGWNLTTLQSIKCTAICTLAVLLLYILKKILFIVVAFIFDRYSYAEECIFNVYLYNRVLCICLYPIVIALAFIKPSIISTGVLLVIGYVICALVYVLRIFREIRISLKNRISFFYIFLYFCTLEILPLMLLVKVITSVVFAEFNII